MVEGNFRLFRVCSLGHLEAEQYCSEGRSLHAFLTIISSLKWWFSLNPEWRGRHPGAGRGSPDSQIVSGALKRLLGHDYSQGPIWAGIDL